MQDHDLLPALILGVSGVSGYNAFYQLSYKYGDQVIGQRPQQTWKLNDVGIFGIDLTDVEKFRKLVVENDIRTIINCGGSCHLRGCELDPEMAHRINVRSIEHLLDVIDDHPVRLVHLSIDLVYSGIGDGDYVESDPTDPVTVYGKTMVQAEQLILQRQPKACVLRISLPMGISFNGHAGAIDWIQSRFARNLPATLYFDEIRTPTYCECLTDVIEEVCCRTDMSGIYHAGGPVKLSLFEIAQIVNRVGGYDPKLLHGCPRIEAGPIPPRAGNVTMDSSKLRAALGRDPFVPWPLMSDFIPTSRKWHCGDSLPQGCPELIHEILYRIPQSN